MEMFKYPCSCGQGHKFQPFFNVKVCNPNGKKRFLCPSGFILILFLSVWEDGGLLPSLCVCPKWLCNCRAAGGGTPLRCKARLLERWPLDVTSISVFLFCPPIWNSLLSASYSPLWLSLTHIKTCRRGGKNTKETLLPLANSLMSGSAGRWTHAGPGPGLLMHRSVAA